MKVITVKLLSCIQAMFHHYSLHAPEPIGQFAGSLLPFSYWQHN